MSCKMNRIVLERNRRAAISPVDHRKLLMIATPGTCWPKVMRRYSPASRVSASPNLSSFTPMRSMTERYMLHSLRLPSPLSV